MDVVRSTKRLVGPWSRWTDNVVEIAEEAGMYHIDTIVIPGLRTALVAALQAQADSVCTTLAASSTATATEKAAAASVESAPGGRTGKGGWEESQRELISAQTLLALPPYLISRQLLALVSMFNLADSGRYANYVALSSATGQWVGVHGPDGVWAGSQPVDDGVGEVGEGGDDD